MESVTHIVIGLGPLIDHDHAWLVKVKLEVLGRVEVQGACRVVRDGHARLTHIGVRTIDVYLVVSGALDDDILDRGLTDARFSSKVY